MRFWFRILSFAFLPLAVALAGCNSTESSDNTAPAVQPDHTVTNNVAEPAKPGTPVPPPSSVATTPAAPAPAPAETAAVEHFNTLLVAAWLKVQSVADMSARLVQTQVVGTPVVGFGQPHAHQPRPSPPGDRAGPSAIAVGKENPLAGQQLGQPAFLLGHPGEVPEEFEVLAADRGEHSQTRRDHL